MREKKRQEKIEEQETQGATDQEKQSEEASWQAKAQEFENNYKRALADYQNLEKRMREERRTLVLEANKDLLLRFLPILDTLMLAQQHDQNPTLTIVVDQFLNTLKSENVTKVKTVGEKFDPTTMEVVTTGEGKEGIVIQEVRAGYFLNDKLLRPAQVIVGSVKEKSD